MARTTLNIDTPILQDLKRLQKQEKISLGRLVSALLAEALARRREEPSKRELRWHTAAMGARVELEDKDALYEILDRDLKAKLR